VIARTEAFVRRYKAGQRAREARGRLKKLQHVERLDRPQENDILRLSLHSGGRSGDLVLRTLDLRVGFTALTDVPDDERLAGLAGRYLSSQRVPSQVCLFACPNLILHRLERAALLGPNGSGKTTFLRTILGQVPPLSGSVRLGESVKVVYFSQTHEGLDLSHSPLDEILSVKNIPVSQARNFLSRFLFHGDEVFKPLGLMSGGERSRIALAKLTLVGANFLILDEPTNHLDIASREVLEEVLLDFDGTILLVSHDRYVVDALATQIWVLEGHELRAYDGGYSEYLEQRHLEEAERQDESSRTRRGANVVAHEERGEVRRRQQSLRKQMEQANALEKTISELEHRLAQLGRQLSAASQAQRLNEVRELGIEYSRLETELDRLLTEWAELSAEASMEP